VLHHIHSSVKVLWATIWELRKVRPETTRAVAVVAAAAAAAAAAEARGSTSTAGAKTMGYDLGNIESGA
jgi:hypothetical protein